MTTLPSNDTVTRQRAICEAVAQCYPYASVTATQAWLNSSAKEQGWSVEITHSAGTTTYTRHDSYAEALRYWEWEWRLLNAIEFCEALTLIDQPLPDDASGADWFDGLGDMG